MGRGIQSRHGKLGRCPFRVGHDFWAGPTGCVGWAGGRSGAGGGWASVKVGNAGGACRSGTWATEEGGQKIRGKIKTKEKSKTRRGEEGEKEYIFN